MRTLDLHTVCESARCPNQGECWEHRTATFMILGDVCTRACGFCAVTSGRPAGPPDEFEPERVAQAVEQMNLRYAVVTSVNRDDQPDGGSAIFARTIAAIRQRVPDCKVEVLIPDFRGDWAALATVMNARPDVLNHNLETVPRLYRQVRPGAIYTRSLELLRRAKRQAPAMSVKTGMMLGFGETRAEVLQAMASDCAECGADILTLGQYLQPTREHLPVVRYVHPDEFADYKRLGEEMGFKHVEACTVACLLYYDSNKKKPPAARHNPIKLNLKSCITCRAGARRVARIRLFHDAGVGGSGGASGRAMRR